jgi:hypothetical protein
MLHALAQGLFVGSILTEMDSPDFDEAGSGEIAIERHRLDDPLPTPMASPIASQNPSAPRSTAAASDARSSGKTRTIWSTKAAT